MSKDTTASPKKLSMDQYTEVKNQLTAQIIKKQELDAKLMELEAQIYEKESDYFEESTYGNIVKGFENFSKISGGSGGKKRMNYTEDDHIFSLSSANFVKAYMKRQGVSKEDFDDYEDSVDPAAPVPASNGDVPSSPGSTPGRKRKARILDD